MGKLDGLQLERLPRDASDDDRKKQYRIDLVRAVAAPIAADPKALAESYADARKRKDALAAQVSEVDTEIQAYWQMLFDYYEANKTTSMTFKGLGTIRAQSKVRCKVTNRAEFVEWCKKNNMEDQLSMHWATLDKMVESMMLEDGVDAPPGVSVYRDDIPVYTPEKK